MRLAYMRLRKAKLCLTVIMVTKFWSVHLNYQHISYKENYEKTFIYITRCYYINDVFCR